MIHNALTRLKMNNSVQTKKGLVPYVLQIKKMYAKTNVYRLNFLQFPEVPQLYEIRLPEKEAKHGY